MLDFLGNIIKGIWEIFVEIISSFFGVLWEDYWEILLIMAAAILLWYFVGYDTAAPADQNNVEQPAPGVIIIHDN